MKTTIGTRLTVALISVLTMSGCTQMPTEKVGIVDMRPQMTFKGVSEDVRDARVLVDGLDMGAVGEYIEGTASLRTLPGVHIVKINFGGRTLIEEKIYLGDGVIRTILVK